MHGAEGNALLGARGQAASSADRNAAPGIGSTAVSGATGSTPPSAGGDAAPSAHRGAGPSGGRGSDLPESVRAVVTRWNPQGAALLQGLAKSPGQHPTTIVVLGPDDASTELLRQELRDAKPSLPTELISDFQSTITDAAVVVILLDSGSPLSATASQRLARLSAEHHTVIFAMTAIHAHPGWSELRERHLARLREVGFADPLLIPVSAQLAARARAAEDSALLDRSGIALLHAHVVARSNALDVGDGRLVRRRVVRETLHRIEQERQVLADDGLSAALRTERAELVAARDRKRASASMEPRRHLQLVRVELATLISARVRALHNLARGELDTSRPKQWSGWPDRLQRLVDELTAAVDEDIAHRLGEVAATVGQPEGLALPRRRDPPPSIGPKPTIRRLSVEDHLMIVLGASAGFGLGRLLVSVSTVVPTVEAVSIPITLLLGGGVAVWLVRARRLLVQREHLRRWLGEAVGHLGTQFEGRVATALVEAETALTEQAVRDNTARVAAIDRQITALDVRIRRESKDRPALLAACARDAILMREFLGYS